MLRRKMSQFHAEALIFRHWRNDMLDTDDVTCLQLLRIVVLKKKRVFEIDIVFRKRESER